MDALVYTQPWATLTLDEGLAEYHAHHHDLVDARAASPGAREFFRCHDAAHVVFGCGTGLVDEAIVKTWSLFGTTEGLRLLPAYRLPEAQEIYVRLRWGEIARTALRSTWLLPRVIWRCRRMREPWPWSDFDAWRGVALCEVRRQFGIRVLGTGAQADVPAASKS